MKQIKIYVLALLLPFFGMAQWDQIGQNILGDAAGDRFGVEVSISDDGNIIAIGAYDNDVNGTNAGQVKIFENIDGTWTQVGQSLYGDAAGDGFGRGLSLNNTGKIIAIGAGDAANADGIETGKVRVYQNTNGTWTQIGQTIEGIADNDEFGFQLSLNDNGTIVAVGARSHSVNSFDEGHARIFENINGTWTQIGQAIEGTSTNDSLGSKISINGNGDTVAIAAPLSNQFRGHVEVHRNTNGVWTQIGQNILGEATSDLSGQGLAMSNDGNIVAIGSRFNDSNGDNAGNVRVFGNVDGNWVQIGQELVGVNIDDNYGGDVALSNDGTVLAVSSGGNGVSSVNSGYCTIYKFENNSWAQVSSQINPDQASDRSNFLALSANGGSVVIGTSNNDNNGQDAGLARVFGNALLSVEENSFASEVTIYPNPAVHNSTISLGKIHNDVSIQVFNMNGKEVMSNKYKTVEKILIDASRFSSGIYIINLVSDTKKATIKMIKR